MAVFADHAVPLLQHVAANGGVVRFGGREKAFPKENPRPLSALAAAPSSASDDTTH